VTLEEYCNNNGYFKEDVIWSFVIQLCSVIDCVHKHGQACRHVLSPSKILVTGKNRFRLNSLGIEDVLPPKNYIPNITQAQYHDLYNLGQIIVNMACKSNDAMNNLSQVVKIMKHVRLKLLRAYSQT